MNRRRLLRRAAVASVALCLPRPCLMALAPDDPYRQRIGLNLYTLRHGLQADAAATLQATAEAGYKQVETFGFPDCLPVIRIARDKGLEVNSSHLNWECITNPGKQGVPAFSDILLQAKDAGLSHLVVPYLNASERTDSAAYLRIAERCNTAAALARSAGIQLGYHNHSFEFQPLADGQTGYGIFMAEFAPEMHFEVDVFWVKAGGAEPLDLLRRLHGRVSQVHLKDLKAGIPIPEFGKLPDDAFQELGDGIIPMEPILTEAAAAGVKICHVEQDQSPDPIASIRQSLGYLLGL